MDIQNSISIIKIQDLQIQQHHQPWTDWTSPQQPHQNDRFKANKSSNQPRKLSKLLNEQQLFVWQNLKNKLLFVNNLF
jgi:hypothetical protein